MVGRCTGVDSAVASGYASRIAVPIIHLFIDGHEYAQRCCWVAQAASCAMSCILTILTQGAGVDCQFLPALWAILLV